LGHVLLRPETYQAIFVQLKNVLTSSRRKLPFECNRSVRCSATRSPPAIPIFDYASWDR